jgi:hypothetical protein
MARLFTTNFLDAVQDVEMANFINYSSTNKQNVYAQRQGRYTGHVAYPVTSSVAVNNLISNTYGIANGSIKTEHLFSDVTKKIITITEQVSLKEAVQIAAKYRLTLKNNFYGAAFKLNETQATINLFHPLVAVQDIENLSGKLFLYYYSDRQKLDGMYNSHLANPDAITKHLNDLLLTVKQKLDLPTVNIHCEVMPSNKTTLVLSRDNNISIRDMLFGTPRTTTVMYIIAHQLMTKGIFAPYYGTSITYPKFGREINGNHITPFRSANISGSITSSQLGFVCTGKEPKTYEGLCTLTHSNLASAYNKHNLSDGSLVYADMCINLSLQIYKLKGHDIPQDSIIDIVLPAKVKTTVKSEWRDMFLKANVAFIKYLATVENKTSDEIKQILTELQ